MKWSVPGVICRMKYLKRRRIIQEVKYRVVRKNPCLLKKGDFIKSKRGEVVEILVFDDDNLFALSDCQPMAVKTIKGEKYWPTMSELWAAGFIVDDKFLVIEDYQNKEIKKRTDSAFLIEHSGMIKLRLSRIRHLLKGSDFKHRRAIEYAIDDIESVLIDPYEGVAESATTEAPASESHTIEIDGERFTVTRKPCGGWSEPVPWVLAVGDEVNLSELSEGDCILIPGVIHDQVGEAGKIGVRLTQGNDCVKWFRHSDKVIYNGRAE